METTMLYATKHPLSQKDTLKLLDSTLPKHLHQSFELNPTALYSLLQRSITYTFSTQMLKQHSSMAEGFLDRSYPNKVLRLRKSLYGLKQAPRIWYLLLCQHILNIGFKSCESDPSIYTNI